MHRYCAGDSPGSSGCATAPEGARPPLPPPAPPPARRHLPAAGNARRRGQRHHDGALQRHAQRRRLHPGQRRQRPEHRVRVVRMYRGEADYSANLPGQRGQGDLGVADHGPGDRDRLR